MSRFFTSSAFSSMNLRRALDVFAHQRGEDLFGGGDVFELHLQQRAAGRDPSWSPRAAARSSRRGPCSAGPEYSLRPCSMTYSKTSRGVFFSTGSCETLQCAWRAWRRPPVPAPASTAPSSSTSSVSRAPARPVLRRLRGRGGVLARVLDEERPCSASRSCACLASSWRDSGAAASVQSILRVAPCASVKVTEYVWCSSSCSTSETALNW